MQKNGIQLNGRIVLQKKDWNLIYLVGFYVEHYYAKVEIQISL